MADTQNHTEAIYQLALCYQEGKGVDRNVTSFLSKLRKVVEKGHLEAMFQLAFYDDRSCSVLHRLAMNVMELRFRTI